MRKLAFLCCAALVIGQPASAQKKLTKEEQWAVCFWKNAPESARNWLGTPPTKNSDLENISDRFFWLGTRLQGFCRNELTPPGKKFPIQFRAEKVWAVLPKFRPQAIASDAMVSDALRCVVREEGNILGISVGFGEQPSLKPEHSNLQVKCQRITSDGTLIDA